MHLFDVVIFDEEIGDGSLRGFGTVGIDHRSGMEEWICLMVRRAEDVGDIRLNWNDF